MFVLAWRNRAGMGTWTEKHGNEFGESGCLAEKASVLAFCDADIHYALGILRQVGKLTRRWVAVAACLVMITVRRLERLHQHDTAFRPPRQEFWRKTPDFQRLAEISRGSLCATSRVRGRWSCPLHQLTLHCLRRAWASTKLLSYTCCSSDSTFY